MNKKKLIVALAFVGIFVITTFSARAEETSKAPLAQLILTASVSLDQGLRYGAYSAAQGKPISGKFEIEDGALQLSIYLANGGKFSEVIIDHQSGSVKKTEAITGGDDLKAAKAQNQAMKKAKVRLDKAVRDAVTENPGYRAISVMATLKANRPLAEIALVKGAETRKVFKPLD